MKKVLFVEILLAVYVMTASSQWILQPSVTTADLWKIKFIGRNNGWIVGQEYYKVGIYGYAAYRSPILRTTDAGNLWSIQTISNSMLHGIEFVNPTKGWVIGKTAGNHGLIYATVDGGATWTMADSSSEKTTFYAIQYIDSLHGWIGGWDTTANFVRRTTDGGLTWQTRRDTIIDVMGMYFVDAMNGWLAGYMGTIFKTTDGGDTWKSVITVSSAAYPLRRISFADALHGIAVGGLSGKETKVWTSDGGVTWKEVLSQPGSSLHGLWFTNFNSGWTVGGVNAGLTIQKTTDGGQTWAKQQFPSNLGRRVAYFEDITFVTATEGWIVADSGVVLKTTNAGEPSTGIAENSNPGAASEFQLNQNYPNPFNPLTTIQFNIPKPSHVTLRVIDLLGQVVATLVDTELEAGTHQGQFDGTSLSSGIYIYRLQSGSVVQTRKMVLMK